LPQIYGWWQTRSQVAGKCFGAVSAHRLLRRLPDWIDGAPRIQSLVAEAWLWERFWLGAEEGGGASFIGGAVDSGVASGGGGGGLALAAVLAPGAEGGGGASFIGVASDSGVACGGGCGPVIVGGDGGTLVAPFTGGIIGAASRAGNSILGAAATSGAAPWEAEAATCKRSLGGGAVETTARSTASCAGCGWRVTSAPAS